jgi:hypothetical protein
MDAKHVSDLKSYFESAVTVAARDRRVGIEVETLFVDGDDKSLTCAGAQAVFRELEQRGWHQAADQKSRGSEWHRGAFSLKPEVGAGNLELISPPQCIDTLEPLLDDLLQRLDELYTAAGDADARPLFAEHDGCRDVDNILLDNERDRRWAEVDGRNALKVLGHIASVHVTVDLTSIDEGFELIRGLNDVARKRGWPPESVHSAWQRYFERSRCEYAPSRFGAAPETFEAYLELLRGFRVVVDRAADGTLIVANGEPGRFGDIDSDVHLPTFLGTVWLNTRLRRIGETLALEVRFIPRSTDAALRDDVGAVLDSVM